VRQNAKDAHLTASAKLKAVIGENILAITPLPIINWAKARPKKSIAAKPMSKALVLSLLSVGPVKCKALRTQAPRHPINAAIDPLRTVKETLTIQKLLPMISARKVVGKNP
jgi:hypothetical protein